MILSLIAIIITASILAYHMPQEKECNIRYLEMLLKRLGDQMRKFTEATKVFGNATKVGCETARELGGALAVSASTEDHSLSPLGKVVRDCKITNDELTALDRTLREKGEQS